MGTALGTEGTECMAGGPAGGTEGTLVALGTFPVGTFQSTFAAASLNSWAGIWSHTFVHSRGHSS